MSVLNTKMLLARGQGFEPRLTGPEPVVLPLDDPRRMLLFNHILPSLARAWRTAGKRRHIASSPSLIKLAV